ncbi:MAG: ATPase P [Proteobacteria bacterium]|nr:ATPase P [Pseudomonadota bacterium]MBU1388241.1 ATPase P [Pseudomonadota bacterium]MBU1541870.1 ATPase P [Pseudomonadota bacterium]MBU2430263.1 ATPase P [Pseudomonadota bacterium]MBU2479609.1 ATPase P [Pseudomonadota bacterium]
MKIEIPGRKSIEIKNIVFDYNGTIAIDGKLIKGVSDNMNALADCFDFYVITADTFGSVEKELKDTNCNVIKILESAQDVSKLNFVKGLGPDITLAAGNGRNDSLMLKAAAVGIGILQEEGICTETVFNSDILLKSVLDVFKYLRDAKGLIATLRN